MKLLTVPSPWTLLVVGVSSSVMAFSPPGGLLSQQYHHHVSIVKGSNALRVLPFPSKSSSQLFARHDDTNPDMASSNPVRTSATPEGQIEGKRKNRIRVKARASAVYPLWKTVQQNVTKYKRKTRTILTCAAVFFSVFFSNPLLHPDAAMAAPSGGRMGGGSFGGRSSSSRSYRSSSSTPRYSARPPSSIRIAPSIGNRGYYGYNYNTAPPIIVAPGGPQVMVVRTGPTFGQVFSFIVSVAILFSISNVINSISDNLDQSSSDSYTSALGPGITVAQISVAMRISNRNDNQSILSFLNRLSQTASTDSRVGVSNLVSQVALEILRQRQSVYAAGTEYQHYQDNDANRAMRDYNTAAIQERSKFEKENTNKYDGVDYSNRGKDAVRPSLSSSSSFNPQATSAVITLLLSIDGNETKLPTINSVKDLERALTMIATDVKVEDCLRSAEVLWTPNDDTDVLTEREVYVDYPKLRSV